MQSWVICPVWRVSLQEFFRLYAYKWETSLGNCRLVESNNLHSLGTILCFGSPGGNYSQKCVIRHVVVARRGEALEVWTGAGPNSPMGSPWFSHELWEPMFPYSKETSGWLVGPMEYSGGCFGTSVMWCWKPGRIGLPLGYLPFRWKRCYFSTYK